MWRVVFEVHQHTYLKAVKLTGPDLREIAKYGGFFVIERKAGSEGEPPLWGSNFEYTDLSIPATHWIPYHAVRSVTRIPEEEQCPPSVPSP